MSKTAKRIISGVGILLILFFILNHKMDFISFSDEPETAQASPASSGPSVIPVNTVTLNPEALKNTLKITGSVIANEAVELKSEISGKIETLRIEEGQSVKKGQFLLGINDDDLQAQLASAKYQKDLRSATEYRQGKLLARGAISQEEYDVALTELNTAIADIDLLEAQIEKTSIAAPFSGTVGLRYVSEGAYISPTTTIASIYNINPVKIEFSVPGRYISRVKTGNKITFTTESSAQVFDGEIYAIEPQVNTATRSIKMRAISQNDEKLLLPGQFVDINLILETKENALMVPSQAVIPELKGHKVFVYKDGKALSRSIEIGLRTETQVEVLSGLEPNEVIITSGLLQIRDQSPVSPIKK